MRRLWLLPALLPAALALVACPGPIDTGNDGKGPIKVGPEGGRFIREGAYIDVPKNAVTAETTILVDIINDGLPEVPGRVRVSFGYRFRPTTLKFAEPITVAVPYDAARFPSQAIDLATLDMRRRTGDDPYLALPSPRTLTEPAPVVTARSDGLGTFWVTSPEQPAVSELKVDPKELSLAVGQTQQVTVEVTDPAGAPLPDVEIAYSIAPARVASVTPEGLVTALDAGTALLTINSVGLVAQVPVYVIGTTVSPTTFVHENPFPTGNDLFGGQVVGGQLVLVGANATVLSRSGSTWTRHFSTPDVDLHDVGGTLPGPAVAVGVAGNSGVLLELPAGETAPKVTVHNSVVPYALWFDGTHGMAVGTGNDVLVRRDGEWVTDYSPSFEKLLDVVGDGQGGFVTVGARGSLYAYDPDAKAWDSLFQTQLSVLLTSAVIEDAQGQAAWAVGGGKLWRFESEAWTALNLPVTPALDELTAVGVIDGKVFIGGREGRRGIVLVHDPAQAPAAAWTDQPLREPQLIRAFIQDGAQAGFAVGDVGALWRYDAGTFTELSSGFYGDVADLYAAPDAVVAVANECVDAACQVKVGRVYARSAAGSWQPLGAQPFTAPLFAVAAKSATDVWVAGQGSMWRFDGFNWTPQFVSVSLFDLAVCGGDYWAVGSAGNVFRGTTTLTAQQPRGGANLNALHCPSPSELWMGGTEVLWRNTQFVQDPGVNHADWHAVWSPGPNEAFAFGDARYGVSWNTQRMIVYDRPGQILPQRVTGLWGASVDTLYLVGHTVVPKTQGFALRFNGRQWLPVDAGASRRATAVHGRSASEVWLTTEGGGILKGLMPE